jgi:hypothetical protein
VAHFLQNRLPGWAYFEHFWQFCSAAPQNGEPAHSANCHVHRAKPLTTRYQAGFHRRAHLAILTATLATLRYDLIPNSLEFRIRAFSARTPVRRASVVALALFVLTYLAMMAPELLHAPSRRIQIKLTVAWCLGIAALLMLVRLWRHITRDAGSAPHVGV